MPLQPRPAILRMTPYSPGKPIDEVKRELGLDDVVKLASNENPRGPSPRAVAAVQAAAHRLHVYPDAGAYDLRQGIAQRFGVRPDQVLLGNGSDELIHLLGLVFLAGPNDRMIVGDPSFVRYDAAAHLGDAQLVKVPLTADYRLDLPAMARAADDRTRLVWLANPNNPTGTTITRAEVQALLRDLPETTAVVLDEAYFEFATEAPDYPDSREFLTDDGRVIGLRTMSKAYGLAGIRLGYGFAPAPVADAIERAREPFNCNLLAQVAALAALDDHDFLEETVRLNAEGRERLNQAFRACGATPVESYANFVLADLHRPAEPVFQALLRQGVIVRSGHVLGLPTFLRVSIGTRLEVDRFIATLGHALDGAH